MTYLWSTERGSLSVTGMLILERSFPIFLQSKFHKFTPAVEDIGTGSFDLLPVLEEPLVLIGKLLPSHVMESDWFLLLGSLGDDNLLDFSSRLSPKSNQTSHQVAPMTPLLMRLVEICFLGRGLPFQSLDFCLRVQIISMSSSLTTSATPWG